MKGPRLLLVLALLLPGAALADDDSDRLCKSLSLQPAPCYARWAPNLLFIMKVGASVAARDGRKFDGVEAMKQERDLYAYTMKSLKSDPEKAAILGKAHAYAQESYKAILPRDGVSEAERNAEIEKRRAQLTKMVEKLAE